MRGKHAILRAKDRYDIELTRGDLNDICDRIQKNQGEYITQDNDKKTHWWLEIKGVRCRIIISADFYDVVTFLPPFEKSEKQKLRKARQMFRRHARRKKLYKYGHAFYEESHSS